MQEVKISLQIGEITHEIGEKNNTAGYTQPPNGFGKLWDAL